MVLVDTSVWITHFRQGSQRLKELLADGDVMCHPFVIGELACGNLKNRVEVLDLLRSLPQAEPATLDEVLSFVAARGLSGKGIGFIDVHLLASALIAKAQLWTEDKRLQARAQQLELAF